MKFNLSCRFIFVVLVLWSSAGFGETLRGSFCQLNGLIEGTEASASQRVLKLRTFLQDRHVVYVSGFMGETGFSGNRIALLNIYGKTPITILNPPTEQAIEQNVGWLLRSLAREQARFPDKKLLILGHSKGAAEVVQMAATHPELFQIDNIWKLTLDQVVAIHAPMKGAVLADLELELDDQLLQDWRSYTERKNISNLGWLEWLKGWLLNSSSKGFYSLTRFASTERNAQLIERLGPRAEEIRNRVFFVTSSTTRLDQLPFYLRTLADFKTDLGYIHDGLVVEEAQVLPEVGTHLLSIQDAGHFSLTTSSGPAQCQDEFTRLLFLRLSQEANQ